MNRRLVFRLFLLAVVLVLPCQARAQDASSGSGAAVSDEMVSGGAQSAPDSGVAEPGGTVSGVADSGAPELDGVSVVSEEPAGLARAGAEGAGLSEDGFEDSLAGEIQEEFSQSTGHLALAVRIGIAGGILLFQILFIYIVSLFFKWFALKVGVYGGTHFKPFKIKKVQLVNPKQIINICQIFIKALHYVVTIFQLYLTIPMIFSQFEATRNLASTLFGWILSPLKKFAFDIVAYIPNLITIILILAIMRYVILRALKFFSVQIQKGKLVIPGFYADWAQPTYNILRALLYAFTVAIVYPYLPGSDSAVFQGVSVFVGIIFSLGSSSAIGNLVAGMVLTYMRPFKTGDRIKIKDITGFVIEKSPFVVRVKTHKNEYVTFPNMMILSSSIVNYHTSSTEDEEGLIIHAEMTMGYAVPWPKVHKLLIASALKTPHVQKTPKPYVLQTALDDYYCRYQINAYTKDVDRIPVTYSELCQNIQDQFRKADISLTAPGYQIRLHPELANKPGDDY